MSAASRFAAALAVAGAGSLLALGLGRHASAPDETPAAWSRAAARICAHALLFEGRHEIGTRAGAIAVARDIRASTEERLARIAALPPAPDERDLERRWVTLERRLATAYAVSYVRIFTVIAAARTPAERAREPRLLEALVHAPDAVRREAAQLEQRLGIHDCTGGDTKPPPAALSA